MNSVQPVHIQAIQSKSPNELLKELVFADHTPEELDTLEKDALERVQLEDSRYISFSMDRIVSIERFIKKYIGDKVADNRCVIHKTLKECSSSSEAALQQMIMINIIRGVMDQSQERMKIVVWFWKQNITSSMLEEIEKSIKTDIDIVFQLARDEKDVWKRAFLRQPDIQPVRTEYTKSGMINMMIKELEGVNIPDTDQLRCSFLGAYYHAEKNPLIIGVVEDVMKQIGMI
jgi:hypothetical protein